MNKRFIQKVYTRIGFWIQYERKTRLELTNDVKYKQIKFILLQDNENFLNFLPNEAICSRNSLSRIENGKICLENQLIKFILNRFGKKYRIRENEQKLIDSTIYTFYTYFFINDNIPLSYLTKILYDTNLKVQDNFLWDEDFKILNSFLIWIEYLSLIKTIEFDEIFQKFRIYHKYIQDILIYYLAYSVYFNPELWNKYVLVSKLIKKEYSTHALLSIFDDLFNNRVNNVYRIYYRNTQHINELGYLKKVIHSFKCMFNTSFQYHKKDYHNLTYIQLINKINTKDYIGSSIFELSIFRFLEKTTIDKNYDIKNILILIKDEPYPRKVNDLIIKQIYLRIKSKSLLRRILNSILSDYIF